MIHLFILFVLIFGVVSSPCTELNAKKSVAVVVEIGNKAETYKIDTHKVSKAELLDVATKLVLTKGASTSVNIFLNEDLRLSLLTNIIGVFEKAGFTNIHMYYFGSDKQMMAEIILTGPAVPYNEYPATPKHSSDQK